jgi:cobalt/nickel transport system permease protein
LSDWLFKDDDYKPEVDKDKFIDKSIVSMLKVISRIKREDAKNEKGGFYFLSPTLKLLFTLAVIVFVSLARSGIYIGIVFAGASGSFLMLNKEDRKRIFYSSIIFSLFTAITLMPSMLMGNLNNSLLIILKVITTITLANVLSHSTRWKELSRALKLLFIPDIFILIFELTLRYIYVLGEAAAEMLYALKLRSVGKNNRKYSSMSGILGSLFLKSKEMGEEVYSAMECRGFTGEYKVDFKLSFSLSDIAYSCYNIIIIAMYFII